MKNYTKSTDDELRTLLGRAHMYYKDYDKDNFYSYVRGTEQRKIAEREFEELKAEMLRRGLPDPGEPWE